MANWTSEQLEMMAAIVAGSHDRTDPKYQPQAIGPDVVFPGTIGQSPSERIVRSIAVGADGVPLRPVPDRLLPSPHEGAFAGFEGIAPAAVDRIGVQLSNEVDAQGRRVTVQPKFGQTSAPSPGIHADRGAIAPIPEIQSIDMQLMRGRNARPVAPMPMPRIMRPADPGLKGNPNFRFGTPGMTRNIPRQMPPVQQRVPLPRAHPAFSFLGQGAPQIMVSGARPIPAPAPMPERRPVGTWSPYGGADNLTKPASQLRPGDRRYNTDANTWERKAPAPSRR